MSDDLLGNYKLTDAIPNGPKGSDSKPAIVPEETHAASAEQRREAEESQSAHNAQGELRDRLVDIGKAHHMAGRSGGRVGDT